MENNALKFSTGVIGTSAQKKGTAQPPVCMEVNTN